MFYFVRVYILCVFSFCLEKIFHSLYIVPNNEIFIGWFKKLSNVKKILCIPPVICKNRFFADIRLKTKYFFNQNYPMKKAIGISLTY